MKVNVYDKSGGKKGEVELPQQFSAELRPDLVRKAVNAFQANRRQPYGPSPEAGFRHAQRSVRSGQGVSRVPRMTSGMTAVLSPAVVGGRRAHPPKVEKKWSEKINKKEKALATAAALAATADAAIVAARGHRFKDELTVPVVVEDGLESIGKTKDLRAAFEAVGLGDDLTRADEGQHQRAGIGKMRGRRLKTPKSFLFVVADEESPAAKAARNLLGVDVTTPSQINVERVAPGGDQGRLIVFTEKALAALGAGGDA